MKNIYGYIYGIIIFILIIIIAPHLSIKLMTDQLTQLNIKKITEEFAANVKAKGYISKDMYEHFIKEISYTGKVYNVTLIHENWVKEPEYIFRSVEDIVREDDGAWDGPNELHQHEVITTRPVVDDPVFPGELNTETNESVLESAVNTPTDPGHAHTDECYLGTKHVHTGSPSSGGGCYGGGPVSSRCNASLVYSDYRESKDSIYFKCSVTGCPGWCSGEIIYLYIRCANGHYYTSHHIKTEWKCDTCSSSFYQGQGQVPPSCTYLYSNSYILNCGKIEGRYYNGDTEVFPVCNLKIKSIAATHPVQTVATGDPLITTVRVTYLDGSTKVVLGSSSFSTASPCQHQAATIIYTYSLGGNSYTLTCIIDVTVIPRSKTCSRGHVYNIKADGSDPGCPYCKAWVDSLRVIYPTTYTFTITIGTTLQENGLQLLVTYMDGRTEIITSGYADNLDKNYYGTQIVTIGYKGESTSLQVITVRRSIICSICGNTYALYPDGTDPGCPYCKAKIPVFTGNVLEYNKGTYTDEIVEAVFTDGIYYMHIGDVFSVRLASIDKPYSLLQGNLSLYNILNTNVRIAKNGKN